MRNMAQDAGYMALDEVKKGRTAMILFPHSSWGAVMFDMGLAPPGIFMRVSNKHTDLRSVAPDTLILVAANDDNWDQEGLAIAKEKLSPSASPKLISIFRNVGDQQLEDEIREGHQEIWE